MFKVYKAYKGNVPDSAELVFFEHEDDAKQAVARLNEFKNAGKELFYQAEGWEYSGYWTYEKFDPKPMTLEEFNKMVQDTVDEFADMEQAQEEGE